MNETSKRNKKAKLCRRSSGLRLMAKRFHKAKQGESWVSGLIKNIIAFANLQSKAKHLSGDCVWDFLYAFTTRPAPICLLILLSCQSIIKRVTRSRNFRFQRLILLHGRARRQTRKASNSLNNNKVRERLLMNRSPFAIWTSAENGEVKNDNINALDAW